MNELEIFNGNNELLENVKLSIVTIRKSIKQLEEKEKEFTKNLLEEMEKRNIKSIDNDMMKITYKAPYEREDFDKKKFKETHEDLYNEFVKFTPVKSSVSIKLKGE